MYEDKKLVCVECGKEFDFTASEQQFYHDHGFENEPEKGKRCERCYRYNLRRTAEYAANNGFDAFTTSLTVSPHKPSAKVFAATDDPRFMREDFKKKEGFRLSVKRAAELGLYRQAYCGCEFSKAHIDGARR